MRKATDLQPAMAEALEKVQGGWSGVPLRVQLRIFYVGCYKGSKKAVRVEDFRV